MPPIKQVALVLGTRYLNSVLLLAHLSLSLPALTEIFLADLTKVSKLEKQSNLVLAKSYRRPVLEKTMRPTSASQRMASSLAFLNSPLRRFEKVTCRLVALSILLISIFPLPISSPTAQI